MDSTQKVCMGGFADVDKDLWETQCYTYRSIEYGHFDILFGRFLVHLSCSPTTS